MPEASASDLDTLRRVRDYTMTSPERQWALINAVRHVVRSHVPGDIVECGVWRGGAAMAAALTLRDAGSADRQIWLYDTFAGMTAPGVDDLKSADGTEARRTWLRLRRADGANDWCRATLAEVRANMATTGYPSGLTRFVQGPVKQTLRDPANLPASIAILRLDTDWYESTRTELEMLYPRLSNGGVLIIDDYGHWQGARKAVDEYFAAGAGPMLLNRIDDTGRIGIKYVGITGA